MNKNDMNLPPFPPRPPKMAWLVFGVVLYLLLGMGYVLYSSYWQNGLFGFLAQWQFRIFGFYERLMTAAVMVVLLLLPLKPVMTRYSAWRRDWMSQLMQDPQMLTRWQQAQRRKSIFQCAVAGILLLLMGYTLYAYLMYRAGVVAQTKIQTISVKDTGEDRALEGKYFRIFGKLQGDLAWAAPVGYISGRSVYSNADRIRTEQYLPLTSANWNPDEPIEFFVKSMYTPIGLESIGLKRNHFSGELFKNGLPPFIKKQFIEQGLVMAPRHYLLIEKGYSGEFAPAPGDVSTYWAIPVLIFPTFALCSFVFAVIYYLSWKKHDRSN